MLLIVAATIPEQVPLPFLIVIALQACIPHNSVA
jgi:hypothetical protein